MSISKKMETCPLKQHIRAKLWKDYMGKLRKNKLKYLTLYCSSMMDIKYFTNAGYVNYEDDSYHGVTAITDKEGDYSDAISRVKGRPELLKFGRLHKLIEKKEQDLIDQFPFDAINLDYCNHIYGENQSAFLSSNLEDIRQIIKKQAEKTCPEFVFFITTRTDKNSKKGIGFSRSFIKVLQDGITLNNDNNVDFREKYTDIYKDKTPAELYRSLYDNFITIGLIKLVAMELATRNYAIMDCSAYWLIRNQGSPELDLLHLALHIRRDKAKRVSTRKVSQMGARFYIEKGAAKILDRIKSSEISSINEIDDRERLNSIYKDYLIKLKKKTFEIQLPEPKEIEDSNS